MTKTYETTSLNLATGEITKSLQTVVFSADGFCTICNAPDHLCICGEN